MASEKSRREEEFVNHTSLQDQGTSSAREDGLIHSDRVFGVLDGTSAPHSPRNPPEKFFGRLTGGEVIARLSEGYFAGILSDWALDTHMLHLSDTIARFQERAGISLRDAGELAGATFAIAKIGDLNIEIVQGGDSFALWEFRDGQVGITKNQNKKQGMELHGIMKKLRWEVAGAMFGITPREANKEQREKIRDEVWDRYCPILRDIRRRDVNNPESPACYALLNGQSGVCGMMQKFSLSLEKIKTLLLFTDGAVPGEIVENSTDNEIAPEVLSRYKKGGLPYLLAHARSIEKETEAENHIDAAEFTAIALEF